MNRHSVPLAGVAQYRPPRSLHSAVTLPRPRQVRTLEPLVLVVAFLFAAMTAAAIGLLGWAAWACCGGML